MTLLADIDAALRQLAFSPPCTPDRTVTDQYASEAAEAVLRHILAAGWRLERGPGEWWQEIDLPEDLRATLRYPILMAKRLALRGHDPARYWRQVAEAVAADLAISGWQEVGRTLVKHPPARPHSTPG